MFDPLNENDYTPLMFGDIVDFLLEGNNLAASKTLSDLKAKRGLHPCYTVASIQSRVLYALGNTKGASMASDLAQQLNRRLRQVALRARQLGNDAFASNQLTRALSYYVSAILADPCDMRISLNMSAVYLRQKETADAYSFAKNALRLGLVYGNQQRLIDKARARATAALQLEGEQEQPYFILSPGFQLQWAARHPAADVEAVESSDQSRYQVEYDLGFFTFFNGNYRDSAGHFEAAIALRPTEALPHIQRAACRLRLAEYAAGAEDSNRAIALKVAAKAEARALLILGLCQFAQEHCSEARKSFVLAGKLDPRDELIVECVQNLDVRKNVASTRVFEDVVQQIDVEMADDLIIY